jgi:hypothetical protein
MTSYKTKNGDHLLTTVFFILLNKLPQIRFQ